jgi:acylphosphatase
LLADPPSDQTASKLAGYTKRMNRRTYHFSGRVQGVGFRYTARHAANGRAVTGYVRNLDDGRVELVMEGPDAEMDAVLDGIRAELGHYISRTTVDTGAATGEFNSFGIRH